MPRLEQIGWAINKAKDTCTLRQAGNVRRGLTDLRKPQCKIRADKQRGTNEGGVRKEVTASWDPPQLFPFSTS